MVCSSFKKTNRFPSLNFLGAFCIREKAFHLVFSTFSPLNVKIPVTVPHSSIVGINQIPLWVHLNFSPLQETSSQGNQNQTTLTQLAWPGFGP